MGYRAPVSVIAKWQMVIVNTEWLMDNRECQPGPIESIPFQLLKQNPSQNPKKLINNNILDTYVIFQFTLAFKSDKF